MPFAIASCVGMAEMFNSPFDGMPPDTDLFSMMIGANACYTLTLMALIVLLSLPTARGSGSKVAQDAAPPTHPAG